MPVGQVGAGAGLTFFGGRNAPSHVNPQAQLRAPPFYQAPPQLRIWTLRIWGFRGPGFRSTRQLLCGDASRLFLDQVSKQLSSVLGRTELCHEVRNPGPQKPQIIRDENDHLALFDSRVSDEYSSL